MGFAKLFLRGWVDMIAAGMSAIFNVLDFYGLAQYNGKTLVDWHWLSLGAFVIFAGLVYVRVFNLKNQLETKQHYRALSNQLAKFSSECKLLLATQDPESKRTCTMQDVENWLRKVIEYLRAHCGEEYVEQFSDFQWLGDPISEKLAWGVQTGAFSKEEAQIWRYLGHAHEALKKMRQHFIEKAE